MKIALVCPFNMLDRPGGVPQVVIHLHQGLKKRGHQVKVITQRPSKFKGQPPEDYILLGKTMTFNGGFGTEGNWGKWPDSREVKEVVEREKFDVINFHEPWIPWLAWQIVKYSKAAHVGTFHANLLDTAAGRAWTSKVFEPYGRPLLSKMDIFTATSPVAAGMLINRANKKSSFDRYMIDNIRYIPCGVELSDFKPLKKRQPLSGPGSRTIVYVGRIEKRKGVEQLIWAFEELVKSAPNANLIVAGQGVQAKKLRQYVEDQTIPNVKFPGYVTNEEKLRLIRNADLACFPSPYGEGFGIVLLEAMAVGTPLVAGNNLGYAQVMKGPGRVCLVDPYATKDFANRLAVMLEDQPIRKVISQWALNEVKQYDYPRVVAQYEQVYRDALVLKQNGHKAKVAKQRDEKRRFIRRILIRRHA